ncbi:MAG: hypothetical protein JXR94_21715 [Candidatus Hydrogenedentes bacterium]|nr:hypothetical protein [Candidatus Hydrogenedentota bacterium]
MIELQLGEALALYSMLIGVLFFAIWIYTEVASFRIRRKLEKQYLWRCVYCRYTYLDEGGGRLSECPRCKSINAADDKGARFIRTAPQAQEATADKEEGPSKQRNTSRRKRPHQRRRGPRKR